MKSIREYVEALSLDDLDEEQRELAECIGLQAYKRLITDYAGLTLTVRTPERIIIPLRNADIRKEFDGHNFYFLARKYGLHEKTVRNIVNNRQRSSKPV